MKLSRVLATVLLVGGVLMVSSAALALPSPMCFIVGDVDSYNIAGAKDQGAVIWPGGAPIFDGRSAAEKAATNGAQFTDSYSTLFPGSSPADIVSTKGSVLFPKGFVIHDGSFVMAMADFQASTFGAISMDINGVALDPATQSLESTWNDGFEVSTIRSFVLTPAQIAAANAAGQLIVNFDHLSSGDFIAFDWFKECANVTPVPVPPTAILLGSGLLGLVGLRFRRNRG